MNIVARFALACCLFIGSAWAGELRVLVLEVERMQCYACVQRVQQALKKVPGVHEAVVDLDRQTAIVKFDSDKTNADALTKATAAAGFPSRPVGTPRRL